ncbi:MAG: hypothetical protein ACR2NN_16840 [Bryobacteraceae bacterium]
MNRRKLSLFAALIYLIATPEIGRSASPLEVTVERGVAVKMRDGRPSPRGYL